ncbi:MAG: phage virion morphogenesis protein [Burkholderiaceae bacterium]|nr:phage virion morphogenesis protein [Burkholderiaceae bacterium]
MAGTHLSITVDDAQARAMLARLGEPGTQDLMPRLGEYLQASTKNRFKTQTKPDGSEWDALKPSYARRKKYNRDKVLTLRGYLLRGIRYQVISEDSVAVGTNSKYGAIHQLGGIINKTSRQSTVRYRSQAGKVLFAGKKHAGATVRQVTIPAHQVKIEARPFLGISAVDDKEIRSIILDWVVQRSGG